MGTWAIPSTINMRGREIYSERINVSIWWRHHENGCHMILDFSILSERFITTSPRRLLLLIWFSISAWISNCIHYKVQDEINYQFPNFNGAASNFNSHYWAYDYSPRMRLKLIHVDKRDTGLEDGSLGWKYVCGFEIPHLVQQLHGIGITIFQTNQEILKKTVSGRVNEAIWWNVLTNSENKTLLSSLVLCGTRFHTAVWDCASPNPSSERICYEGYDLFRWLWLCSRNFASTLKPVSNDHLYDKIYYLWFIE